MIINREIPIYIQLADRIKDLIMESKLHNDDRIPSVRELAATYEVNNNTAMRSIELLAGEEIIYQKRGMGYFVNERAKQIIETQRQKRFTEEFIPVLRKAMTQLSITKEQLIDML